MESTATSYSPSKTFVSSFSSYLLNLVYIQSSSILAASTSENLIKLYDAESFQFTNQLRSHTSTINDLIHSQYHPNQLFSCSSDNTLIGWDLKSNEKSFTTQSRKPLFSCDIGSNGTAIVAGSESYISIWDLRKGDKPVLQYNDCHSDTVTQIRFNPANSNYFCSGSEDGLICLFDITQNNEDDALRNIAPINHCVNTIGFFDNNKIYCCTSTEQFSLWDMEEATCIQDYGDIRDKFSSEGNTIDYMIKCYFLPESNELLLFAASYAGDIVVFQAVPNDLIHKASLSGGHTEVVRTIQYLPDKNIILSGAEDGRVCEWKPTVQKDEDMTVDDEKIDYLTGDNLRREEIRKKYRYILNPYYLKDSKKRRNHKP